MKILAVNDQVSVSGQLSEADLDALVANGIDILVCNRPDNEAADQPSADAISAAARARGVETVAIQFKSPEMRPDHVAAFARILDSGKRIHAYCRTGNRSFRLYASASAKLGRDQATILAEAASLEIDVTEEIRPYFQNTTTVDAPVENMTTGATRAFDVVIVGAGSGGIAAAASLLKRRRGLRIALVDPVTDHYYQPGWTMVGGGIFDAAITRRATQDLIPRGVTWIRQSVAAFDPAANEIHLDNGDHVRYEQLIVAPGLLLDWAAVKGLPQSLGKNGVTSNYAFQHAPYTWKLVQGLKRGRALFTQPPMPIKCAGAPQKAMYLSCDYWYRQSGMKDIEVSFCNAAAVLFGVSAYVPALESYVEKYGISLLFGHNLVEIDSVAKIAYFSKGDGDSAEQVAREFDMIHVCPPQRAPDFVAQSELAAASGWLEVEQHTLQHVRFPNVWGLGDVMNTPNAKTMAAVRKQVPVVATNLVSVMEGGEPRVGYDGYGSCPLTVENGKIVLAEFGYGGKLLPTFPTWLLEGTKPTRRAWFLKKSMLPAIYWQGMLKGHEWLAAPRALDEVRG